MHRTLRFAFVIYACAAAWPCAAQDPRIAPSQDTSLGVLTPTPEMWFYEQERMRHDDTKLAIRRRAEQRGFERHERLASQKWYGVSNSRPIVTTSPVTGSYSAFWGSNSLDPMRWRPVPYLVERRTSATY